MHPWASGYAIALMSRHVLLTMVKVEALIHKEGGLPHEARVPALTHSPPWGLGYPWPVLPMLMLAQECDVVSQGCAGV